MSDIEDSWLPPAEAMRLLGVSRKNLNRMCRDGLLHCKKRGRTWYVHKDEFE